MSYPAIAQEITEPERNALEDSEEPGIELLRELIDNLREHPAQNSAQVIERWAGKPGGDSLEKLLQREQIVADAVTAAAGIARRAGRTGPPGGGGASEGLGGEKSLNSARSRRNWRNINDLCQSRRHPRRARRVAKEFGVWTPVKYNCALCPMSPPCVAGIPPAHRGSSLFVISTL